MGVKILLRHVWNQVLNAAQAEILQNKFTVFHVVRNWKEDTKTQHEIQLSNIFLHTGRVYVTQTTHFRPSKRWDFIMVGWDAWQVKYHSQIFQNLSTT